MIGWHMVFYATWIGCAHNQMNSKPCQTTKKLSIFQRYLCNVILKDFLTLTPQNHEFYIALGWGLF